uniref:Uncharacterized protein n=1 Tax=Anguilla anguilla TaxID=7936 RepID=A0A0E9WB64_ANGAN
MRIIKVHITENETLKTIPFTGSSSGILLSFPELM